MNCLGDLENWGARHGLAERFIYSRNRQILQRKAALQAPAWYSDGYYEPLNLALPPIPEERRRFAVEIGAIVDKACAAKVSGDHQNGAGGWRAHIATHLRSLAAVTQDAASSLRMLLRADAVECGYSDAAFTALEEPVEVDFVANEIVSWYGKHDFRLPTAFHVRRENALSEDVQKAAGLQDEISTYLSSLHSALTLSSIPRFSVAELLLMAGEGNSHPKHIAYFLPTDEGVAFSRHRHTYYLHNVHMALVENVAAPLRRAHLQLSPAPLSQKNNTVASLGVFCHEVGHSVGRSSTDYRAMNKSDRWASVSLQELAADVFGTLILAEVVAPHFGVSRAAVLAYHLSECLRYVDRGLGCFADSDGMFLQLAYLCRFGALQRQKDEATRLSGEPDVILACFRSLARVLADTLLETNTERAFKLFSEYGPSRECGELVPLLLERSKHRPMSIAYV